MSNSVSSNKDRSLSVAVCIGTYNQAQYLNGAIASVLAQSYPVQKIWVSDDASTDGTDAVMQEICAQHPKINYYRQPINLGPTENLSWVLAQPSTDLIVRLDSDDFMGPDYVKVLVRMMVEFPEAGYAHCAVNEIDINGEIRRVRRLKRSKTYETPEESLKRSASGFRVAANCILFRAAALKQANYYYANASWKGAEDWDLSVRMAILGWGNVYSSTPLTNYRFWVDSELVRFKRRVQEIECVTKMYKETLEPEYIKRGWRTGILRSICAVGLRGLRMRWIRLHSAKLSARSAKYGYASWAIHLRYPWRFFLQKQDSILSSGEFVGERYD